MKTYILSYFATAFVFLAMDAIWLSTMGGALYRPLLGNMLLEKFSLLPAVTFYLLYVVGIVIFAVAPAFETGRWATAGLYGALFGFFAYATYDLTNQATLKDWSAIVTAVDLCWGTVVTGVAATLGYSLANMVIRATGP
jgi:uncharacterized membrane protein